MDGDLDLDLIVNRSSYRPTEPKPILVQAPIESPLNMAHTFSRKAEMLTKRNNYEEAISCHSKAAECILQAMESCTSPILMESLQRQHKSYLSQMERISVKTQLLTQAGNMRSSVTVSRSTQTDSVHSMNRDNHNKLNEDFIYQILRENDDMISSVMQTPLDKPDNQNKKPPSALVKSPSDSACDKNYSGWTSLQDTPLSRNKNDVKLDALKMNERLGQCVKSLLQELSSSHAEKKKMEEKLSGSGDSFITAESGLKFSTLNLPPLESSYPEIGQFSPQTEVDDAV